MRFGGNHVVEPLGLRLLLLGGEHLYLVAGVQDIIAALERVVDLGTDTVLAEFGVQLICQIEHRSALRERLYVAARGKDEHLLGEQVQFERVKERHGIGRVALQHLFDVAQPLVKFGIFHHAGLVFPVCSQTLLGKFVHASGADLYLHPVAVLTHDGDMQRFVAVGFRCGYPVAYSFGVRTIDLRDGRVDHPALVFLAEVRVRREYDTHGKQVIHLVETDVLRVHLTPDGVGRLDTCREVELIAERLEFLAYRLCKPLEVLHTRHVVGCYTLLQLGVGVRVFVFECEVLQFALDGA